MLIFLSTWAPMLWLLLAIALGVIEAVTIDLVAIWFAAGAFVAILPALLGLPGWVQLLVFLVVSVLLIVFTRPAVAHLLKVRKISTNADRVIGMTARVTTAIDSVGETGRIQVDGLSWAAASDDGSPIAEGENVLIKRIDGVKLIVERI